MNPKWLALAADMLQIAADVFSNHGCNDWFYPASWSEDERREFARAIEEDNGTPGEYDPEYLAQPDWRVMDFLAGRLRLEAKSDAQP